jgi:NAD(P)-dependent dehydrogenase (short-subunit alcohol dehydrogenase family)
MARLFITGSAGGLGQLAAERLVGNGNKVVLHARNVDRGREALSKVPAAEGVVTADLSDLYETKRLAEKVNGLGEFDAVIHNAAVYQAPGKQIVKVNILAPYVLTCLIQKPQRLVYMSSGMHGGGNADLDTLKNDPENVTYSDSKLYMVMLAKAVARRWPDVFANVLDPGWVPTRMGGPNAPDSLKDGYSTQVWLAASDEPQAMVSGCYFKHKRQVPHNPQADDVSLQDRFLKTCEEMTGVSFP